MYKLLRHKFFKKDLSKIKFTDTQFENFIKYCGLLVEGKKLPYESLDHKLKGDFIGYREFHIGGDLLVVYKKDEKNKEITLVAIGSHNQIFKNKG